MTEWRLSQAYVFDGRTVRYAVRGDGPPVVLVHGTPWSSFNLRHLIKALSEDFTVYYYDLLGYGQSDKAPGFDPVGTRGYLDTPGTRCGFARYDPGLSIPCDSKCRALGDRRET